MAGQFLHSREPVGRQHSRRRVGQTLLLLTLFALLTGCSLGFIYPRLDTIAGWQLDRYLRLESGQEAWLDERLEERLSWHQREQLPQWRDALLALRADIANGTLDAEAHQRYSEQIKGLMQSSASGLVDDAIVLAAGLTDAQVQHFLEHYDEETEELAEEVAEANADPEASSKARQDDLIDEVENWLGKLSPDQKTWLRQWSQDAILWRDYALDSRLRWRDFLIQTLANRQDPVATRVAVEQMLLQRESLRSADYDAAIARQAAHRRALHLYLLQSLTEKQKQHLLAELDDLLDEVNEVLADPV